MYVNRAWFPEMSRSRPQRRGRQVDNTLTDRSYDFGFKTPDYQRRENSDALGRVRGDFSKLMYFTSYLAYIKNYHKDSLHEFLAGVGENLF